MSVHAPSLPASPSIRAADFNIRRLFQTPSTPAPASPIAGPSSSSYPALTSTTPPPITQSSAPATPLTSSPHHNRRSHVSRGRFNAELSQCLVDFVVQLLPTPEELRIKEDVRQLLEGLIRKLEPSAHLLSFGSSANGFALRNSDMDLCCMIDSEQRLSAADLVTSLSTLLDQQTKFTVKPLPYARIPIVKLSLDPSPGLPQGIACDIGFDNKLAMENTRLLMCYAMIDPTRVRTMVLFLKVWSKRRKINSPYRGTLSSYGYVLMVLYFLTHVKNPPVLPNLQQIPPMRAMPPEDMQLNGNNIWFFDDIELLRQRWQSQNTDSVADLLADFFKYYARDFSYNTSVISLRAGAMRKEAKGWQSTSARGKYEDPRERNRFCIEDPFETEFNVARCVSKDGLYLLRGEFMRAHRVFTHRPERAFMALSQLCEERQQEELPPLGAVSFIPARPPPQTPYTVGGSSMRPQVVPSPESTETLKNDELSSASTSALPEQPTSSAVPIIAPPKSPLPANAASDPTPPDHMAPRRSQYTSPPPPDAPLADQLSFEDRWGQGLVIATAPTDARQRERTGDTSASASEIFTDDGRISDVADLDDVRSVRSFTEETLGQQPWTPQLPPVTRSPSMMYSYSAEPGFDGKKFAPSPLSGGYKAKDGSSSRTSNASHLRGRKYGKADESWEAPSPGSHSPLASPMNAMVEWPAAAASRRSASGPPRALAHRYSLPGETLAAMNPLMYARLPLLQPPNMPAPSTIFYETGTSPGKGSSGGEPLPSSTPASPVVYTLPMMAPYPHPMYPHHLMDPRLYAYAAAAAATPALSPLEGTSSTGFPRWGMASSHEHLSAVAGESTSRQRTGSGPKTPTPSSVGPGLGRRKSSHSHNHSTATVVAPNQGRLTLPSSRSRSHSRSPERSADAGTPFEEDSSSVDVARHGQRSATFLEPPHDISSSSRCSSSRRADSPHSLGTDSPAPSSPTSSNYVTSPSTSPPSPSLNASKDPTASDSHTDSASTVSPGSSNHTDDTDQGHVFSATAYADASHLAEKTPVGTTFDHA